MLKKFILCLIIFLAIFTIFFQKKLDKSEIEKGITLDIARKHYTEHSIKQIIKHLSKHHGTYLQLHFSDNENYSIYSKMLKQTSNKTNSYFLTKKELKSIIKYANKRNVQIIPEIDLPSHSKSILTLLRKHHPDTYQKVVSQDDSSTIDFIDNKDSLKFSKDLISEISGLFKQPKYKDEQKMVIGGDEVPGSGANQQQFVKYINQISNYANSNNYETKIWNDSITKEGLKQLDQSITVMYWQQKNQNSLTPKDFFDYNHQVENFNSQSLYLFPRDEKSTSTSKNIDLISDTKITSFNTYHNHQKNYYDTNLNGVTMSFWGEFASSLSQNDLIKYIIKYIKIFF